MIQRWGRRPAGWLRAGCMWAGCVWAGGLWAGCAPAWLSHAEAAYEEERYGDVAEDLSRHEDDVESLSDAQRARYGLYRGLALIELGDHGGARRWLGVARAKEELLGEEEQRRLEGAWTDLAKKGIVAGHHEMPSR